MAPHYDPPNEGYTTSIPSGTKAIREGVAAHFGIIRHEVIRDQSRCNHQASEHCVCRGVDWYTRDVIKGTKMRKFLIFAGDKLGIQAAIFNNIVWGFGTWRERSPASSPHEDHVHGGVNKWAAKNVTRAMVDAALAEWDGEAEEDFLAKLTEEEQQEILLGIRELDKVAEQLKFLYDAIKNGSDKAVTTKQVKALHTKLVGP